jgi:hypothetical protein
MRKRKFFILAAIYLLPVVFAVSAESYHAFFHAHQYEADAYLERLRTHEAERNRILDTSTATMPAIWTEGDTFLLLKWLNQPCWLETLFDEIGQAMPVWTLLFFILVRFILPDGNESDVEEGELAAT